MTISLPKQFQINIHSTFGEQGERWLALLPKQIAHYIHLWELTDLIPVDNLTYNYVMLGKKHRYPEPVVLKLGVPNAELAREIAYLAHYQGEMVPKLLAEDVKNGAMLMERVVPGNTMTRYFPQDEEAALAITAQVIQRLQMVKTPIESDIYPRIETWHASLMQAIPSPTLPEKLVTSAKQLSIELIATQTDQVLLHGDLHHDNLLYKSDEQWLAIDPKGIIGDPIYEVGAFIRNPVINLRKQTNMQTILRRRIAAFAEYLSFDSARIVKWSFVQAVLAACWSMEENNKFHAEYFIECAKVLETL